MGGKEATGLGMKTTIYFMTYLRRLCFTTVSRVL